MKTISTHILTNGLRIIHCPSPTDVVYCGYAINAGTRDEQDNEQGMAHFVEHLLFKGTSHRKAWHILNRMENVGGDLNAFTNKEETIVYSTFLKEHFMRAAELLTDIVFHSTFPENQIEKEVEVIIDEIQSYEDSPAELIFDDFEELIFPNHPLGRNILGKPELLRSFGTEDALRFTRSRYRTGNMVFFIMGNIEFRKVVRTIEKITNDIPAFQEESINRLTPPDYVPRDITINRDTHQSHVMIGTRAYDAHDKRRTGLYLLNNILGGPGMNSRLNIALREKNALVYNVESNLTSYTDTGVFSIYFGCDPEDKERCIELARKELKKLRENLMKDSQLSAAKKQIIGQLGVASDNFENCALDMGKCFLHYNRYEEKEEVYKRIENISASEILDIANDIFSERHLSTLVYN
ncbi:insulinase family protein [Bacteroides caecigallinarum]|uniref:M16 family metallopeptidase n=1 Tax=Bacteroides caecigallinarum TaxID=1411144 RepID=UPI001F39A191|nr:pitrilysin family protein [Bacteroides caecigallinarum]MCF2592429.1 insulinase family protein [Bacteroides caecigallinarum]